MVHLYETGCVLGYVSLVKLKENIALISDFKNNDLTNNQKSIWFENCVM